MVWVIFNVALGILFGIFHQGGVIPAQFYLGNMANAENAVWWKTYSPPTWLLGEEKDDQFKTIDLMSAKLPRLVDTLEPLARCGEGANNYLIAPLSAVAIDDYSAGVNISLPFWLKREWEYRNHLNLDDLDFGDDGFASTLGRVVGRRGLGAWRILRTDCPVHNKTFDS